MVNGLYTPWSSLDQKTLWCPDGCLRKNNKYDVNFCCSCKGKPEWELPLIFPNISYSGLALELEDLQGKDSFLLNIHKSNDSNSKETTSRYFWVTYIDGILRRYPKNACDFQIVTIDFTGNLFSEIGNLSCFSSLDTLVLKRNRISFVSNQTFRGLPNLRKVDLSYNLITKTDNNLLGANDVYISELVMEGNNFSTVDLSNIVFPNKTICYNSYAYNYQPLDFTNELNMKIHENISNTCGSLDISNVPSITQHPLSTLKMIGLEQTTALQLKHYVPCGFYKITGTSFKCDCTVFDLMNLHGFDFYRLFARSHDDVYCNDPKLLANKSFDEILRNETLLDLVICKLSDSCHSRPNCECRCISQPNRRRLLIDCSNQSCTDFPDVIPESSFDVEMDMSNNKISTLRTKDYFSRVKILDLSENPLTVIDENVDRLNHASHIFIPNHSLETLPESVQFLHPDIFRFGKNGIPCNCDNTWIGDWRIYKSASKEFPLLCSNFNNTLFEDGRLEIGNCESYTSSTNHFLFLLLTFPFLISLFVILYCLRFELIILKRKYDRRRHKTWKHDVYISFDENNKLVLQFVIKLLYPFLKNNNISAYIPCKDDCPGKIFEENITDNIQKCKTFVLITSDGMYDDKPGKTEAKIMEYYLAWKYFTKGVIDKIFVVKFDKPKRKDFQYRKTEAFYRTGMGFNMWNRKVYVYQAILELLQER
ncbi:SLIT2 [Mytilus coruscus]|uniref:SLIT2 n=1 Tax=Mytilus coruscus TaxID=42192 RepID=A0A6J8A4Q4_MYTCO|nr:SLIT2 [Mytilus coruscus]